MLPAPKGVRTNALNDRGRSNIFHESHILNFDNGVR